MSVVIIKTTLETLPCNRKEVRPNQASGVDVTPTRTWRHYVYSNEASFVMAQTTNWTWDMILIYLQLYCYYWSRLELGNLWGHRFQYNIKSIGRPQNSPFLSSFCYSRFVVIYNNRKETKIRQLLYHFNHRVRRTV